MTVHQPEPPRLLDDLAGPRGVAVVIPRDWADLLLGELMRQFAHRDLLVGKREINHGVCSASEEFWAID
jgi:hypothetical protein